MEQEKSIIINNRPIEFLTMAARGEAYMTIFRPAHKNPMTSIFVSPGNKK